ncbi:MAG: transposase [Psychrobacillus sp.]
MTEVKAYVSLSQRKVYLYPDESPWEYEITARQDIIPVFETLFYQLYHKDMNTFWRAHVPMKDYSNDFSNEEYDNRIKKLYALIHEFSDRESQVFIEQLPFFKESRHL